MFQTTVIPVSRNLHIVIPYSLVGKEVTVSAQPVSKKAKRKRKPTLKEIEEFYSQFHYDLSNFKFNRDEANER